MLELVCYSLLCRCWEYNVNIYFDRTYSVSHLVPHLIMCKHGDVAQSQHRDTGEGVMVEGAVVVTNPVTHPKEYVLPVLTIL